MHDPHERLVGDQPPPDDDPRRLTAALGYVFTPVVPLLTLYGDSQGDRFLRRHAIQGLLWSVPFALLLFGMLLLMVLLVRDNFLYICLLPLVILAPFLPGAFWAWRVYTGRDVSIPIIGPFAESRA